MANLVSVLVALGLAVFLLHRLALWAERRGWIYYRNRRGSALGSVLGAIDPIYNPGKHHQLEEQRRLEDDRDDEDSGAPPAPGMRVFLETERLSLRRFTEADEPELGYRCGVRLGARGTRPRDRAP
jgi:Family of unknown function (DUF6191)